MRQKGTKQKREEEKSAYEGIKMGEDGRGCERMGEDGKGCERMGGVEEDGGRMRKAME